MKELLNIGLLLLIMGGLRSVVLEVMPAHVDPMLLTALGFIILVAFAAGLFFKRIGLPALLGYIAAGLIFGPELTGILPFTDRALFSHEIIDQLSLIKVLTIGVIGTLAGGELHLSELKKHFSAVGLIVAFIFVGVVLGAGLVVYFGASYFPGLVPFLNGTSPATKFSVALLFGVFSFAMSPAATLAVIQEMEAKGAFTSIVLGVVVFADLILVAAFVVSMSVTDVLSAHGYLALAPLLKELPVLGREFFWALVLGGATGSAFILYLRFVAKEKLLFTVGIIFFGSYVAHLLHAEVLLVFLTAGFIVQNYSEHGDELIEALEYISLPVFVVYFMLQAANLNLTALWLYLPIILVLTVVRTGAFVGGIKAAGQFCRIPESFQKNLYIAFLSRGGVDIVLASLVAGQIAAWGEQFRAVIMGIVLIHIIVGPILLKYAFQNVGETVEDETEDEKPGTETIASEPSLRDPDEAFELPSLASSELNERVESIRKELIGCYTTCIERPLQDKEKKLREVLVKTGPKVKQYLEKLEKVLEDSDTESDEHLTSQISRIHFNYRKDIQADIDRLAALNPIDFSPEASNQLLTSVQRLVDFETEYNVDWSADDIEIDARDGTGRRLFKSVRRLYHTTFGTRSWRIPVGTLWRYFVELSVPEYLEKTAEDLSHRNEAFWYELMNHFRRIDQLFERILYRLPSSGTLQHVLSRSQPPAARGEVSHEDDSELPSEAGLLDEYVAQIRRDWNTQHEALVSRLDRLVDRARVGFLSALANPYADFLEGIQKVGTVELPAFRYRPSKRFDRAEKATHSLQNRLEREQRIVAGYQGWITVEHEINRFLNWYSDFHERIDAQYRDLLRGACLESMRNLLDTVQSSVEQMEKNWSERDLTDLSDAELEQFHAWYRQKLLPKLTNAQAAFEKSIRSLTDGRLTRTLVTDLKRQISEFPDSVLLLNQDMSTAIGPTENPQTIEIHVRRWFRQNLVRELALELIKYNERLKGSLQRSLLVLDDFEANLQYLLADPGHSAEKVDGPDRTFDTLDGLYGLLEEGIELLESDTEGLLDSLEDNLVRVVHDTVNPFWERDIQLVSEAVHPARSTNDASEQSVFGIPTLPEEWKKQFKSSLSGLWEKGADWFASGTMIKTAATPADKEKLRQLLKLSSESDRQTPPVYRRLFLPATVGVSEFYVRRPHLHERSSRAIRVWRDGESASLLVTGDKGSGCRTLVQQVVRSEHGSVASGVAPERIHSIRLSARDEPEADFSEELGRAIGGASPRSFDQLRRYLLGKKQRRVVVVENTEHIFSRTKEGFKRCEKFLQLIEETAERTFWVVIMRTPLKIFLDQVMQVDNFFSHTVQVDPFSKHEIKDLIHKRHDVSGFSLSLADVETNWDRPFQLIDSFGVQERESLYFRHLTEISGGNPHLALAHWIQAAHQKRNQGKTISMEPLPRTLNRLTDHFDGNAKAIALMLLQQKTLSREIIRRTLRVSKNRLKTHLNYLEQVGFIETVPGTGQIRLKEHIAPKLTQEFRATGIL